MKPTYNGTALVINSNIIAIDPALKALVDHVDVALQNFADGKWVSAAHSLANEMVVAAKHYGRVIGDIVNFEVDGTVIVIAAETGKPTGDGKLSIRQLAISHGDTVAKSRKVWSADPGFREIRTVIGSER